MHEYRTQGVESPQTVDDRGDTGQQVGYGTQYRRYLPSPEIFPHEEGYGQGEGDTNYQCQEGREQGACDEGQGSVALAPRLCRPVIGKEEVPEAERLEGSRGIGDEGSDNPHSDYRDDKG